MNIEKRSPVEQGSKTHNEFIVVDNTPTVPASSKTFLFLLIRRRDHKLAVIAEYNPINAYPGLIQRQRHSGETMLGLGKLLIVFDRDKTMHSIFIQPPNDNRLLSLTADVSLTKCCLLSNIGTCNVYPKEGTVIDPDDITRTTEVFRSTFR